MKKNTLLLNILGLILSCGLTVPLAAADRCYAPYTNCCEWSFCDGKIILGADWLFWKVEVDGLNLASLETVTPNFLEPQETSSTQFYPHFQYKNGFRVNLGYELPCDCWDVNIAYSYIPAHARISSTTVTDLTIARIVPNAADFPIFSHFVFDDSSTTAQTFFSRAHATINILDVDLGRTVCFGECLKIRPHIGFRAAWMHQKLLAEFIATESATTSVTNHAVSKEHFTGYGVEGGLWGAWEMGCGFSVIGHVGGSILCSKFKVRRDVSIATLVSVDSVSTTTITTFDATDTIHSGTPTVDYFLGLQYADCFCDMLFSVIAGWEQHVVFDVNRISMNHGNLITQGLTLGCQVGF